MLSFKKKKGLGSQAHTMKNTYKGNLIEPSSTVNGCVFYMYLHFNDKQLSLYHGHLLCNSLPKQTHLIKCAEVKSMLTC